MAEIWNDTTTLPSIGSVVLVKYTPGADREYKIIDVLTANVQTDIANDPTVLGWQYIGEILSLIATKSKNLMSGIKEGEENDWAPTVNGYLQQEYDIYMLRQQINGRIQTLPNEIDGFDGIDYLNIIFGKTSVEQKAAAFVEVIKNIPAVKDVTFISASWIDKIAGTFQFVFNIQSVFGDLQFQVGLDIQNKKVFAENA